MTKRTSKIEDSRQTGGELKRVAVADGEVGARLDAWLAGKIAELSRSRIQKLIAEGHVSMDGAVAWEARRKVKAGETFAVEVPEADTDSVAGEDIALNVVYEDKDLIVIDKPAGLVVHPAAGHASGTLVNALIAHCGASLSGIGGVKRPGIVHRLDKDTSGLLVVAKNDTAHQGLSEQFKSHGLDGRLHRAYFALVWGELPRPKGTIDAPLARSHVNRTKIAVSKADSARHAVTHYEVIEVMRGEKAAATVSLVRLVLETGRTHQIRVHLAHIGHPVLGDLTYGAGFKTRETSLPKAAQQPVQDLKRQALHAEMLGFEHPRTGRPLSFKSDLPIDIIRIIDALGKKTRSEIKTSSPRQRRPKSSATER